MTHVGRVFLDRSMYYLGTEYPTKIRRAVEAVPEDALWARPNPESNSLGNLLLHLTGNVTQWVVSGIGGAPDHRDRAAEFSTGGGVPAALLLEGLEAACAEAVRVLRALDPDALLEPRRIQGRDTTVLSALYHAVEHFSGHTGQIIWCAKAVAPGAIAFYSDAGGLARPTFLPPGAQDVD
jgi:uncharacterized damage-inducible protein DinB